MRLPVLAFIPGLTLILITALFAVAVINALLRSPEQLTSLWMPAIGIVGLWIAYMPLPQLIRTGVSRMWQRRSARKANGDQEQEIRN